MKKKFGIFDLTLTALFVAITIVLAQICFPMPITQVPVTLSVLAVFLTSAILNRTQAVYVQLVYILLGAAGVPVFSFFSGGLGKLLGPTGGYIIAYPFMAFIIAFIAERAGRKSFGVLLSGMACSLLVCYAIGTSWLALSAHMSIGAALTAAVVPFVIPDVLKAFSASAVAVPVIKALQSSRLYNKA